MRIRLTEKVIAGLHTTQDQEDILHTQTPGGGIRISKEGRKVFFILFRPPGSRKLTRYSVGYHPSGRLGPGKGRPLPQMTLKEFENAYAIFRGELAQGRDPRRKGEHATPGAEEDSEKVELDAVPERLRKLLPQGYYRGSVGALLVEYFTRHAPGNLARRTFQNYLSTAQTHLGSFQSLRAHDLEAVSEALREKLSQLKPTAPQMLRHVKKVLSVAYEYAMETRWPGIRHNPCLEIRVTVKKNKRERWFADDELVTILAALPKLSDRRVAEGVPADAGLGVPSQ